MDHIKVLIVEENILVRRALTTVLQKYDNFRVSWMDETPDKLISVVQERHPDIVLLSINSLDSNGLKLLQQLQSKFKKLPVIVVSPRSKEGAKAAITALRLGAVDFITKPEQKNLILFAERHLEKRLGPLLKSIYQIKKHTDLDKKMLDSLTEPQKSFENFHSVVVDSHKMEVVVIGGCTGGVPSLFSILSNLPSDFNVPVLVVQHLPRIYTEYLVEILDSFCDITVKKAEDGEPLSGGTVYIAPGGYQSEIIYSEHTPVISIYRGLRENNMRPSIDVLFRSASRVFGDRTLAVLLSGCGYDGLAGAAEVINHKGQLLVQDPQTAIAPELPLTAIRKGLTKEYYSPQQLVVQILQRTHYASKESFILVQE